MRILLTSDFHGDFFRLSLLARYFDLCICCGDIFDYHSPPPRNFAFPLPFYSIKGNKERWGGMQLARVLGTCRNFYWLNENLSQLKDLTGMRFVGIDFGQETAVTDDLTGTDVFISHQPAYGLADQCSDPFHTKMIAHCGNKRLRRLVDQYQPKYIIAGHVHMYQKQTYQQTAAVTLPVALNEPIIALNGQRLVVYSTLGEITVRSEV